MKIKEACNLIENTYGKDLLHPHGKLFVAWDTIVDELMLNQQLRKRVEDLQEGIRQLQIENASLMADVECLENDMTALEIELNEAYNVD